MSAVPSWCRVGAKVACTNSRWKPGPAISLFEWIALKFAGLPVAGGVYTITLVGHSPTYGPSEIMVCLKGWGKRGFHVTNFRPLITQQDDIEAHFKALLDVPAGVDA